MYCKGYEARLIDCPHPFQIIEHYNYNSYCRHYQDAGVRCSNTSVCTHGETRLTNGKNSLEGEPELCLNDNWWKVCINYYYYWTQNNVNVACRSIFSSERGKPS